MHQLQQARHHIGRPKARHHHRHPLACHQLAELGGAHHRSHVAGRQKALHLVGGILQQRLHRRRHPHMGQQHAEIGQPQLPRLAQQQGRGRCRGFKTHRQKHHLALRARLGQGDGLQGRSEQAHIAAGGPHAEQIGACGAAWHPQHVAVGAEDHLRPGRQLQGPIDELSRSHTHRTAGPMDQPQPWRQQLVEPPAQDGVGLPATHLHHRPGAAGAGSQLG